MNESEKSIEKINQLIKELPNDMDLGKAIRNLLTQEKVKLVSPKYEDYAQPYKNKKS